MWIITVAILLYFYNSHFKSEAKFHSFHDIYWNSSNPFFETTTNTIGDIEKRINSRKIINIYLLDTIVIHCPYYSTKHFKELVELSKLYLVSKYGYENCVLDNTSRLIGSCNDPYAVEKKIYYTLKRREPTFGKTAPIRNFYIISTSSGTAEGLYQRHGGLCAQKNMKLKIHIMKDSSKRMEPIRLQDNTRYSYQTAYSEDNKQKKVLPDDEIFMTEEFNELTWKKKITDPRVPMSERLYGGSVIDPLQGDSQMHGKYPLTHTTDNPIHLINQQRLRIPEKFAERLIGKVFSERFDDKLENLDYESVYKIILGRDGIEHIAKKVTLGDQVDDKYLASNDITDQVEIIHLEEHMIRKTLKTKNNPVDISHKIYDKPGKDSATTLNAGTKRQSPVRLFIILAYAFIWLSLMYDKSFM